MKTRNVNRLISLWLIIALSLALANSTARAENVTSVAYRTVTIDTADIFYREAGDRSRKLQTPTVAN